MSEITRLGHHLNSVTPDFGRRLQRAVDLTRKIAEIKASQLGIKTFDIFEGTEIAQKLGVYDKLGVNKSEVEEVLFSGNEKKLTLE